MTNPRFKTLPWITASVLVCSFGAGSALADTMIGINFNANASRSGLTVAPTETAGTLAQQNWNNAGTLSDATDDGAGHVTFSNTTSGVSLMDNTGTTYPTITYTITGGYPGGNASSPWSLWRALGVSGGTLGDRNLMQGCFQTRNNPGTISLSNINAFTGGGTYDLYVYYTPRDGSSPVNLINTLNVNGGPANTIVASLFAGTYIQGDGAGSTGNYLKFTGLTGSSLTLNASSQDYTNGIAGIQLSVVPEPGTLALLAFGSMAIMKFRRKNSK